MGKKGVSEKEERGGGEEGLRGRRREGERQRERRGGDGEREEEGQATMFECLEATMREQNTWPTSFSLCVVLSSQGPQWATLHTGYMYQSSFPPCAVQVYLLPSLSCLHI